LLKKLKLILYSWTSLSKIDDAFLKIAYDIDNTFA